MFFIHAPGSFMWPLQGLQGNQIWKKKKKIENLVVKDKC